MSHQKQRRYRIQTMQNLIRDAMEKGSIVDSDKFTANCCIMFGAGRRYVKEYIKDLVDSGFIVIKGKEIWTPAALEAEEILRKVPA